MGVGHDAGSVSVVAWVPAGSRDIRWFLTRGVLGRPGTGGIGSGIALRGCRPPVPVAVITAPRTVCRPSSVGRGLAAGRDLGKLPACMPG